MIFSTHDLRTRIVKNANILNITILFNHYFNLKGPCAEYFSINKTGVITTKKNLDRDTGEIKNVRGRCFIEIEVSSAIIHVAIGISKLIVSRLKQIPSCYIFIIFRIKGSRRWSDPIKVHSVHHDVRPDS